MNADYSLRKLKEDLGVLPKFSKRYHKYATIADKGFVTKQEIVNLKSILNHHGLVHNLTSHEIKELTDIHEYKGKPSKIVRIELDHTKQGLAFLQGLYKTPTGRLKKVNRLSELTIPDGPNDNESMMNIIENFKEFRYAGFEQSNYNHYSGHYSYAPVWEVVDYIGNSFTYCQTFSGFWRR